MPALTPNSSTPHTILVTGANGFIGTWIVGVLLQKGYKVRGAVRSEEKGHHLLETYKEYGDKLHLQIVGDLTKEGALDEAVRGVEGIIHTASPVHLGATHPKDIIDPAVNCAIRMLTSALKYGSSLRRIVFTSTQIAILNVFEGPSTVSETDWNDGPVIECEKNGESTHPMLMYAASKVVAEKAVWEFYNKHKSEVTWDLAVLHPGWVFGPVRHEVATLERLNPSNALLYNVIVKGNFGGASPLVGPGAGHAWTDVRDAAEAHARALEAPAAGGERIMVLAGTMVWQDWLDVANSLSPSPYSHPLAKGTPGTVLRNITIDTSKEKRILGMKFRTMQESTKDLLTFYTARGW